MASDLSRATRRIGTAVKGRLRAALRSPAERRHVLAGPMNLWKMKREFQIDFLRQAGLRPDQTLLDVGCATLRGGIPLIDYLDEGGYTGIEPREHVLEEARRELAAHDLQDKHPTLLVSGDLADMNLGRRFDVIWAFSVLIHMADDVLDSAMGFASRHLEADGIFYATVNMGERWDSPGDWQGFPNVRRPLEFYRDAAARHGLDVEDLGTLESFGHGPGQGQPHHMLKLTPAGSGS
jgi:SAM-dependent methyltransferase